MAAISDTDIGAIVYGMVPNIPVGISGILTNIVDQQVYFAEQVTGDSIGTIAIADKYQPAVTMLSAGAIMSLMESQGIGTKSVSIGELSITKGMVDSSSSSFRNMGMEQLNSLGESISFYQSWS